MVSKKFHIIFAKFGVKDTEQEERCDDWALVVVKEAATEVHKPELQEGKIALQE